MNGNAPKTIPLPCALLALSMAVCLGATSPAHASAFQSVSKVQAEQRETLVHLLDVIQQAAKKLTDRIDGQAAMFNQPKAAQAEGAGLLLKGLSVHIKPPVFLLRDALLNLPPPTC